MSAGGPTGRERLSVGSAGQGVDERDEPDERRVSEGSPDVGGALDFVGGELGSWLVGGSVGSVGEVGSLGLDGALGDVGSADLDGALGLSSGVRGSSGFFGFFSPPSGGPSFVGSSDGSSSGTGSGSGDSSDGAVPCCA